MRRLETIGRWLDAAAAADSQKVPRRILGERGACLSKASSFPLAWAYWAAVFRRTNQKRRSFRPKCQAHVRRIRCPFKLFIRRQCTMSAAGWYAVTMSGAILLPNPDCEIANIQPNSASRALFQTGSFWLIWSPFIQAETKSQCCWNIRNNLSRHCYCTVLHISTEQICLTYRKKVVIFLGYLNK